MKVCAGVVLALLLLASFLIDLNNNAQGGAIDLRNRITGVRLLEHGIDPYFYKWDRSQPEEYGDPYNNPLLQVSKTTASPTLLAIHAPLAALPYRLAQFLWCVLQWALLLGTAWFWWRLARSARHRWLLAGIVVAFTYTAAWRLHAERGQAYVLLLFLFATWLAFTLDEKWSDRLVTGLLAGFLGALRPPFLLLLPFLALHRRRQLAGAVMGLVLGAGLPMLIQPAGWSHYFAAMQLHSQYYRDDYDPNPPPQHYPPTMEGAPTDTLANYVPIPYADYSVHGLLRWLGFAPFPTVPVGLALLVPFALWLWLARREPVARLILGMAAWLFLADLFVPAYRNTYNDVLILNVMALGLLLSEKIPAGLWPCLIALVAGWGIDLFAPVEAWIINGPSLLFTLGAILFLFSFDKPAKPGKLPSRRLAKAA